MNDDDQTVVWPVALSLSEDGRRLELELAFKVKIEGVVSVIRSTARISHFSQDVFGYIT